MSKKDKFFYFLGIPFIAFMYWLMANALGGWDILAGVMAFFAVGFVVMGGKWGQPPFMENGVSHHLWGKMGSATIYDKIF